MKKSIRSKSFLVPTFNKNKLYNSMGKIDIMWIAPDVFYLWTYDLEYVLWRRSGLSASVWYSYFKIHLPNGYNTEDEVFEIIKEHYEKIRN